MSHYEMIVTSTEIRRHNGQCAYGSWEPLADQLPSVIEAIADEIVSAQCAEMRREEQPNNTDENGIVNVGGQMYVYSRNHTRSGGRTMNQKIYVVEVWTGSRWLALGLYGSERAAQRRKGRGTPACGLGAQERRVRICRDGEAARLKGNMALLSRKERREKKLMWG